MGSGRTAPRCGGKAGRPWLWEAAQGDATSSIANQGHFSVAGRIEVQPPCLWGAIMLVIRKIPKPLSKASVLFQPRSFCTSGNRSELAT